MHTLKSMFLHLVRMRQIFIWPILVMCVFIQPAHADIVDAYNLAPFVPLVLETMMNIATSLYKFFVGSGDGVIYILIYGLVGFYIALYLVKMYLPKDWLSFFGFSGGGEMWDGKAGGFDIAENLLKPCLRAVVACVILLQIKPVYLTKVLVDPFLKFGSLYTESILQTITNTNAIKIDIPECPESIVVSGWMSKDSCNFLVQPVYAISQENNRVIKYGFNFLKKGFRGLIRIIPHGGEDILNILTGIMLIFAFVSSNVFMALLIIRAIFDFCLSLIMYPFNVLTWVAKKSDKWMDILPPFKQIIDALKKLVISMISCAFILCINIAVVRSLFNWSSSVFNTASGGMANAPSITNTAMHFGQHSMLWISSLLTFFLMQNIFNMTRERLNDYTKDTKKTLYENVSKDAKTVWGMAKSAPDTVKNIIDTAKKISGK